MDGQWFIQPQAWNYSLSLHYTFAPVSAVMQISLSSRYDYTEWAVPVSMASAVFTQMTADGVDTSLIDQGLIASFAANNLTEVQGIVMAQNCYAAAIVNQFIWPHV
jgi:hypothetical protein